MIALATAAWAGPFELGASDQSIGAMVSWRTTGASPEGRELVHTASEPALHVLGNWRALNADLAIGYETGTLAAPVGFRTYGGFRVEARGSVTVLSTRPAESGLDPLNVSVGAGAIGWGACCSASGSGTIDTASTTATVFVAERLWLWEPLGIDVRYEVPLARRGFRNTISVGVVFGGRK